MQSYYLQKKQGYHQLFFPDGYHLKPKGNKLLSDVIMKSIIANNFIGLPSTGLPPKN